MKDILESVNGLTDLEGLSTDDFALESLEGIFGILFVVEIDEGVLFLAA